MRISKWGQFSALFALFVVAGFLAPWWAVAAPAFVYGFFFTEGQGWRIHAAVALTAAGAWILPALIQDAQVGWRISARMAGVIGLPGGIFAYFFTVCLGALTSILGSSTGTNLREVLQPLLRMRSADKPAD